MKTLYDGILRERYNLNLAPKMEYFSESLVYWPLKAQGSCKSLAINVLQKKTFLQRIRASIADCWIGTNNCLGSQEGLIKNVP